MAADVGSCSVVVVLGSCTPVLVEQLFMLIRTMILIAVRHSALLAVAEIFQIISGLTADENYEPL